MIKISTGVEGLDEMLGGGFPRGRVYLVSGGPGTGKTIFSLQYLMAAVERGEPGIYVTLEEPLSFIRENVDSFGWDLKQKELSKRLKLLDFYAVTFGEESFETKGRDSSEPSFSIIREVVNAVKAVRAEHVVIDPLTSIVIHEQRAGVKRYKIGEIFSELRKIGCTALFTSEITSSEGEFYMEEFLADGVIRLNKTIQDFDLIKTIRIEKMRGIKYDEQPRRYIIDERGFSVYHTEPVRV
ncbi:MAG: hypothetical protein QG670_1703 [Thermoproteota archaeon]|nr:hypothetical protein [Thermoproteota archaeon]